MVGQARIARHAIALISLAALAACGDTAGAGAGATAASPSNGPAPATSTAGTDPTPEVVEVTPVPAPTVAKTQRRVQIYSGPSDVPVRDAADSGRGSSVVQLRAMEQNDIGTYVADGRGMTLYRFDKDTAKPSKATCAGDCAKTWPPVLISSPGRIYPDGVDPQLVGYVERADGTCQVTIGGWPVYRFAKDAAPGDIKGQGVGGTWFAVSPTGARTKPLPEVVTVPTAATR
ncbi:hypothetical protein [Micromonospora sp. WMMD710]|uniref:hypothetical protein n=1 Tax=Micromonospora sp. WMMD710 TaxID=3016085 RepID=UPI002415F402|nr:hypothetical protein [Micromonospora sp. WMMD710]MDG4759120.1 hypothetical protein [Micromonospora sp. WMMD710]